MAGVPADRKFWSDDDDDDRNDDDDPWDELASRRRRTRIPLGLLAGTAAGGLALLVGIWSMTSSGGAAPATPTVAASFSDPILDSPPPPPATEATDPISTGERSHQPSDTPTRSARAKPVKSATINTIRPTAGPTVVPPAKRSPTVKRSPTATPTSPKDIAVPMGPTDAPPPPSRAQQNNQPSQTGPTEAPPPPGT